MHTVHLPSLQAQTTPIGLIGLGQMGLPIARHLLSAGYHLRIFDLNPDRLALLEHSPQVTPVNQVEEVATPGGIVLSIVPDDQALWHNVAALRSVLVSGLHLGLSTVAPQTARRAEAAYTEADLGTTYLSVSMLGRPTLAEVARLTLLLSGAEAGRQRVFSLLRTLGTVYEIGERVDAAPLLKLAANSLIVSALEALASACTLLRKQGLDPVEGLSILTRTPLFEGTVYREYGAMISRDHYEPARFPVTLGLKDVQLMLSLAETLECSLPIVHLAQTHLLLAQQAGWNHLDWSVLGRVIDRLAHHQPLRNPAGERLPHP
jgi:3-hydroxyisobutyrate dehydrogenase-like beta-hydroxyacid dehydrogenase